MPANQEADQLLAEGAPITLRDGRVLHLRYTMRGVKRLEESFGSPAGIDEALARMLKSDARSFHILSDFLDAGMTQAQLSNGDGKPLTREQVEDLLEPSRVAEYILAVRVAFNQAFGVSSDDAEVESGKEPTPSPGETGSISQPSDTDAPTTSSGTT